MPFRSSSNRSRLNQNKTPIKKKKTHPGEIDDEIEIPNKPLLDPRRGRGGGTSEKATTVVSVEDRSRVERAEEAGFILLERFPGPLISVRPLPRLHHHLLILLFLLLVLIAAGAVSPDPLLVAILGGHRALERQALQLPQLILIILYFVGTLISRQINS